MLAFPLQAPAITRGVHSYVDPQTGRTVYVAVTSNGDLLNGERRERMEDEREAIVVREMWRDLRAQDPVASPRPPFALYVDGALRR